MNILFHLTGTSCSGKSYIQEEFKDNPNVKSWDVVQFYRDKDIIVDGEVNWDNYRNKIWELKRAFKEFIASCKDTPVVFIETIGWNKSINDLLAGMSNVVTIVLAVPSKEELLKRINKRSDIKEETVMYFYNRFIKSELNNKEIHLQPYEAGLYIKEWVSSYELELPKNREDSNKNN